MKKILISVIFIILCIIVCFTVFKGFSLGKLDVKSISGIKTISLKLDERKNLAVEKTSKSYPKSVDDLETSIKDLNIAKEKYEEKVKYIGDDIDLNILNLEKYKVEFLWTKLGNYEKKHKVRMRMDIVEDSKDVYHLNFYVTGSYVNITDFLYDLENDAELNFNISDFELVPKGSKMITTLSTDEGSETEVEEPYNAILSISEQIMGAIMHRPKETTPPPKENKKGKNEAGEGQTKQEEKPEKEVEEPNNDKSSDEKQNKLEKDKPEKDKTVAPVIPVQNERDDKNKVSTAYNPTLLEARFKVLDLEIDFN